MPDEQQKIGLSIDGKTYEIDADDLELGEIELLEEELDAALDDIDFTRAKAMRVLVYLMLHREDAGFTMDDARAIKVSAIGEAEPAAKAAKRPTKAAASG